jgi:tetratricopeptide (TPR) repeat protein
LRRAGEESWGDRFADALVEIVKKAVQAERKDKALEILAQALQVAQTLKENDAKASALAAIASQYAQVGQKNKALEILAQALEIAQSVRILRLG